MIKMGMNTYLEEKVESLWEVESERTMRPLESESERQWVEGLKKNVGTKWRDWNETERVKKTKGGRKVGGTAEA